MACEIKLVKNITSSCENQPVGGVEQVIYLFNRTEISVTYDNTNPSLVNDISMGSTADTGFKLTGIKKSLNCGSTLVPAEDAADGYTHTLIFQGFEFDAASVENMDQMGDIVAVVEMKQKANDGDGTFVIYGLGTGLYKSSDVRMANDANGARKIELTTLDGQLERYSQNNYLNNDYATSKAALEALCV